MLTPEANHGNTRDRLAQTNRRLLFYQGYEEQSLSYPRSIISNDSAIPYDRVLYPYSTEQTEYEWSRDDKIQILIKSINQKVVFSLKTLFGTDATILREKNFQLLLVVTALVPFGSGLLSPILESVVEPFGASVGTIGLMISVFLVPSIVVTPLIGGIADRYGRKFVLTPALVLFGLSGAAIAFTTDFPTVLTLRLLQGIGWAGLVALIVTSIGDLYAGSKEATAQGLHETGLGFAGAAVSLGAGVLVTMAWQFPFLLYLLALPAAVAVYLWFDEPTTGDESVTADGGDGGEYRQALMKFVRQRRILALLAGRSLVVMPWFGFVTYNSVIVIRLLDGTPAQAGILFAIASAAVAVSASQSGRITARVGSRYPLLVGANVCLGMGFIIAVFIPILVIAGVGIVFLGIGIGLILPMYRSLLTGSTPESLRAGIVSIGVTGARIVGVVTPIAMGGTIVVLTPMVGSAPAVQLSGVGVAVVSGGGGIICVLVARASPSTQL